MASLDRHKIGDLPPNHPFANTFIMLGGVSLIIQEKPPLPIGRYGVTVTVWWGYERHSIRIGAATWRKIRHGVPKTIRTKGWYEGKSFPCYWQFQEQEEYTLIVDYGDDGGQGFIGDIRDALIEERTPLKKGKSS